jgi:hypothetical protein
MKTNKPQALLYLYEKMTEKGFITKKESMETLEISELTFRRYLSEIRCYFVNFDKGEDIVYDKVKNIYVYSRFTRMDSIR